MEVAKPVSSVDFHFDSSCSSPYATAPSSPRPFGSDYNSYFSAPTSPRRASAIYHGAYGRAAPYEMPLDWKGRPGSPKSNPAAAEDDDDSDCSDFAFDFSGQLAEDPIAPAEELFDHGRIRPLKPPPRLQVGYGREMRGSSPRSSPKSPRFFRSAFSPRKKKDLSFDPFEAAIENTRKGAGRERGRERDDTVLNLAASTSRRGARSLSPLRAAPETKAAAAAPVNLKRSGRKWRLTDLLLFRSASEGRATDKETLRKYGFLLPRKGADDLKNASFRSVDGSGGSASGSRRGPVSAHEIHYTMNRAASEELRKKTFLPYRKGLLGCMGFNPAINGIASGFDAFKH